MARRSSSTLRSTRNLTAVGDRCVQPPRDRPRGVHESAALVQPIRLRRVLRTAFLHHLTEKHDTAETEFFVDAGGYLTALARHELSGHLDYHDRNRIEKWFQTITVRIGRSHSFWRGSRSSAERWLRRFRHYYNRYRPNQALDGETPPTEVQD